MIFTEPRVLFNCGNWSFYLDSFLYCWYYILSWSVATSERVLLGRIIKCAFECEPPNLLRWSVTGVSNSFCLTCFLICTLLIKWCLFSRYVLKNQTHGLCFVTNVIHQTSRVQSQTSSLCNNRTSITQRVLDEILATAINSSEQLEPTIPLAHYPISQENQTPS